jgi:hypothetical protein
MSTRGARPALALLAALALALGAAACGNDGSSSSTTGAPGGTTTAPAGEPVIDPGDGGNYAPAIDPADFVSRIDNPYLSFLPGAKWVYEGESDGEPERVEIVVLDETRDVMGIEATVVRDTVYVAGELVEDTYDWFAQDRAGNVWYLGEDVKDYENGKVVSTAGSWEAGVDGALPGIVMPADPTLGKAFRQEYYAGEAEDMAEIIGAGEQLTVPTGSYDDVIVTRDWTPLEPDVIEEKYYAPGIGKLREEKVAGGEGVAELVEYTPAP